MVEKLKTDNIGDGKNTKDYDKADGKQPPKVPVVFDGKSYGKNCDEVSPDT